MAAKQRNLVINVPFKFKHGGYTPGGTTDDLARLIAEFVRNVNGDQTHRVDEDEITFARIDEVEVTASDLVNFAQDRIGGRI